MADPQSIVALNIGSQQVTMGLLTVSSNGGLILKKYESSSILADPAAEMTRLPQIRMAIAELVSHLDLSKETVSYAISGQSVFTRFVKLPSLEDDDIEQLVAFEAQQHVPFPINEVVWDWQLLNSAAGQQEVVLVAIKADALDDINECVTDASLVTGLVDASPMALANAFVYNYGDLEEPALMIDIGARTSNLVYLDGKKVFTRTIAIGGSTLTTAIAKEYNVPFIEAESQKCTNGLVALDTRHTSQLDELTAALGSCIRTALNRMPAEIARTTNFFRSQHDGSAPKRIFLAGGGSNLPMISDFFQDKLRLPVEFFNPLKRVSVGQEVDVDKVSLEAHQLGELIGLGLRSIDKSRLNIDLVPEAVQNERDDAEKRPKIIIASAVIIAACAVFCVSGFLSKSNAIKEAGIQVKIAKDLGVFAAPINAELKDADEIANIVGLYKGVVDSRVMWLDGLSDIKKHFAHPELWVIGMEPLVNFDPNVEEGGPAYQGLINKGIQNTAYGVTAITVPKAAPKKIGNKLNPAYVAPMINAIKVRGYWRSDSNGLVLTQLQNLIENSDVFGREISRKSGNSMKKFILTNPDIVVENATSPADDELGAPFTIIIPLNNPILLK
ncbi:MAG: type IV pilus assembly protein PilM [Cryomorphaceae bacterium]|jgi:type IV pilus assembly protein PilM